MNYLIDSQTLIELIQTGQKALSGESNDAEHDALYEIILHLESLQPEHEEVSKLSDPKTL